MRSWYNHSPPVDPLLKIDIDYKYISIESALIYKKQLGVKFSNVHIDMDMFRGTGASMNNLQVYRYIYTDHEFFQNTRIALITF